MTGRGTAGTSAGSVFPPGVDPEVLDVAAVPAGWWVRMPGSWSDGDDVEQLGLAKVRAILRLDHLRPPVLVRAVRGAPVTG
jgi:hypothetical protein